MDIELARHGLSRRVACFVTHFAHAAEIVRASDLISTVPERSIGSRDGLRVLTPPLALPKFTLELVWHERTQRNAEHRWFRERVLELFEARPATAGATPRRRGRAR